MDIPGFTQSHRPDPSLSEMTVKQLEADLRRYANWKNMPETAQRRVAALRAELEKRDA